MPNFEEKIAGVVSYVRGKKTYYAIAACGLVEVLYAFGYINDMQRDALLKFFGGAGAVAFCAKVNRMVDEMRSANNTARRGMK